MANISNLISAVVSFFIGLVMIYCFNGIFDFIINLFGDGLIKMICMFAYLIIVFLVIVYYPIHMLTSEDGEQGKLGKYMG